MTRTMYDALSTEAATIPADAELVAGYIDAGPHPAAPPWGPDQWALFPHAVHVQIATQAATMAGHVLDVENGDATPEQAAVWVQARRNMGAHPSVYCSESAWPSVRAVFDGLGMDEPEWWIAGAPGSVGAGNLYPGSVAHQWGTGPTGTWDISVVADYWPGVDPTPAPPPTDQEATNVVQVIVKGVAFLVWTSAGSIYYRAVASGALQHAAVVPGSAGLVDPTNPTVLAIPVGDTAVVYVPGKGGSTLTVTWADSAYGSLATAVQS